MTPAPFLLRTTRGTFIQVHSYNAILTGDLCRTSPARGAADHTALFATQQQEWLPPACCRGECPGRTGEHRGAFCLVMADETPGDPLARGLPSPVCTARGGRQSNPPEMVADHGERPAQKLSGSMPTLRVFHHLPLTFPRFPGAICCPPAAQPTRLLRSSSQELAGDSAERSKTPPGRQARVTKTLLAERRQLEAQAA
jgi:hypothetical protein